MNDMAKNMLLWIIIAVVLMMVFRPQGMISNVRRKYEFESGRSGNE